MLGHMLHLKAKLVGFTPVTNRLILDELLVRVSFRRSHLQFEFFHADNHLLSPKVNAVEYSRIANLFTLTHPWQLEAEKDGDRGPVGPSIEHKGHAPRFFHVRGGDVDEGVLMRFGLEENF